MQPQESQKQPEWCWGVEKRFEFIEFRLFWEGKINRKDLIDQFAISVPQSSIDLNRLIITDLGGLI